MYKVKHHLILVICLYKRLSPGDGCPESLPSRILTGSRTGNPLIISPDGQHVTPLRQPTVRFMNSFFPKHHLSVGSVCVVVSDCRHCVHSVVDFLCCTVPIKLEFEKGQPSTDFNALSWLNFNSVDVAERHSFLKRGCFYQPVGIISLLLLLIFSL